MNKNLDAVGLIPAAGKAKRISPLPCSKELYPIAFSMDRETGHLRPKVASHFLLEKFARGGITSAYVVLRNGKWDIPAYYGDGRMTGLQLGYVVTDDTLGPPETLDKAYAFVADKVVATGFPDILFGPDDVFVHVLEEFRRTGVDVVLALYEAHDCRAMDMIDVRDDGSIRSMVLKPEQTDLVYTWLCAVWSPRFTRFMHGFVEKERASADSTRAAYRAMDAQGDLPIGAALKAAIESGLEARGIRFPGEPYIDIGTAENLMKALRQQPSLA